MTRFKIYSLSAMFSLFSFFTANASYRNILTDTMPVELKYLGKVKNQPVFQLHFAGQDKNTGYVVFINDNNGQTLYKDFVNSGPQTKKYLLDGADDGEMFLTFEIVNQTTGKRTVYQVQQQQKMTEQMNVVKL